ncbi:MAG: R3H domain-containing nucleic acid-binding protein [Myxococcota bacterium]
MYDQRQEPNEFVADSVDEATSQAAEFFGVDAGELKVVVPTDGEIFGAGGRAVIVAVPNDVAARGPRPGGGGDDRGGDRDRGRGRGRGRDRDDRGDRGERGGRGRGRRERNDRGDRGGRSEERDAPREKLEREPLQAVADSKGSPKGDIGPIGDFLLGAVERMKIGSFEISESSEGDFLIYQLSGAAADALQSGDGRATDALQLIANQVSMRQSEDAPRIVVDVEGGGDEREQTLGRLADRAVKRAKETGRSIALDPMNGRDRRTIHIKIREIDDVATMSIGEGRYRQVLVVPEGAPEYDDAVSESS